jgi:transcriptional/translational regulatory protein YebC/TACO1
VRQALVDAGIEVEASEVTQRPKSVVPLDADGARRILKLVDVLEDNDDVDNVHANFDVPADVMEQVAG